ncbi:uncharacterized protein PRCAT00004395001 [Priceomyces carsonii]|uniref:uncharacterized protein n=1 Tax=Priceomyces carsonii TaxID=28549 RepID=UPI002ED924C2|nr:unnamed protein product [Priceomyces carsonii]
MTNNKLFIFLAFLLLIFGTDSENITDVNLDVKNESEFTLKLRAYQEGTFLLPNSKVDQNYESPPYYPSPVGGRLENTWQEAYEKARNLVQNMTIVEMVNLTTGIGWGSGPCVGNTGSVPRLGIPSFCLQDGPNGVRFTDFVTNFPTGLAVGATFNRDLMFLRGKAIGREFRSKGVHIFLGPTVGPIGLKAAGGRNWEGFGADPYLQGIGGAATVRGIQEEGVVATVRHLIGNEQEHFRQVGEWKENDWQSLKSSISSNIGDRAMHEIYLWPFADVVKAGVGSVMCSYNQVNNSYACENSRIMNYLLKEELGFQGFVMSDWGAQHTGLHSALSGLDMTMPGEIFNGWTSGKSHWGPQLTEAVYNHTLPLERLTDMAVRILVPFFTSDAIELPSEQRAPNFNSWTHRTLDHENAFHKSGPLVLQNKHQDSRSQFSEDVSLNVSREAVILLKNEGQSLPISKTTCRKLLVAGIGATIDPNGFNCIDQQCVDGVLTTGWGSAAVNNPFVITPYEAISKKAIAQGMAVDFSRNVNRAADLAEFVDVAIVVVNADSGEGYIKVDGNYGDRKNLSLWHEGDELVNRIAAKCQKTIVIVNSVGPVDMEQWIENDNVVGVVFVPPLGQYVGRAISEVLFGDVNPSGKLPFTIAKNMKDYVPIIEDLESENPQDNLERDIFLDYRYFDNNSIDPRFEFGFGLSYTTFNLHSLELKKVDVPSKLVGKFVEYLPLHKSKLQICDPEEALFPLDKIKYTPWHIYPYLSNKSTSEDKKARYPEGYNERHRHFPPAAGGGPGGNPALWKVLYQVTADVENVGDLGGSFVAQLYIEYPKTIMPSPPKILRGFDKVSLNVGESRKVNFEILHRDLSIWDPVTQNWVIQAGNYKVCLGSSSRRLMSCGEIGVGY